MKTSFQLADLRKIMPIHPQTPTVGGDLISSPPCDLGRSFANSRHKSVSSSSSSSLPTSLSSYDSGLAPKSSSAYMRIRRCAAPASRQILNPIPRPSASPSPPSRLDRSPQRAARSIATSAAGGISLFSFAMPAGLPALFFVFPSPCGAKG